jgi:hypothetical protein
LKSINNFVRAGTANAPSRSLPLNPKRCFADD